MHIEALREFCLQKPGTTEAFPFDNNTLVFKVMGKMYALTGLINWENLQPTVNLKCDPALAIELREQFPEAILPGYHMNKKHWNTVHINKSVTDAKIYHLINHSYELVVSKLPKKLKEELNKLK